MVLYPGKPLLLVFPYYSIGILLILGAFLQNKFPYFPLISWGIALGYTLNAFLSNLSVFETTPTFLYLVGGSLYLSIVGVLLAFKKLKPVNFHLHDHSKLILVSILLLALALIVYSFVSVMGRDKVPLLGFPYLLFFTFLLLSLKKETIRMKWINMAFSSITGYCYASFAGYTVLDIPIWTVWIDGILAVAAAFIIVVIGIKTQLK